MTTRDRLVAISVAVLVVLGAFWLLVVSPEQKQVAGLVAQVNTARAQLASTEGTAATARSAQARYAAAYSSIVSLGKAVPPSREVPSLISELTWASERKNVEFSSITASSSGAGPAASAAAPATPGAALATFTPMPFTFVFNGTFFNLQHLLEQLDGFVVHTSSGGLRVSGRLLTVQSVSLAPYSGSGPAGGSASSGGSTSRQVLTGTITATAYVLPATQGLTGGATPASPTGAGATPASTPATASSPTASATVRVNP